MAYRHLEWIREKTAKAKVPTVDEDTTLPTTLPFTPSSSSSTSTSRESILIFAPDATATANSPFFQELPFEIRHSILTHAFAGNTLHIMIKPMAYRPPGSTSPQRVRPVKERLWYTVCPALDSVRTSRDDLRHLRPYGQWCKCWSEGFGSRYIGIMGWLLSCRQAYAESIDILYAQNTMHMRSHIIECLPNMILPHRLRSITSVELRDQTGSFSMPWKSISEIQRSVSLYGNIKDLLATLPHLRKLYLSIEGFVVRGFGVDFEIVAAILEHSLMIPMDEMLSNSNPLLRECSMTIYVSCMGEPFTVYAHPLVYLYFQGNWIRHRKQNIEGLDDRSTGGAFRKYPTLHDLESSYTLEAVPEFSA